MFYNNELNSYSNSLHIRAAGIDHQASHPPGGRMTQGAPCCDLGADSPLTMGEVSTGLVFSHFHKSLHLAPGEVTRGEYKGWKGGKGQQWLVGSSEKGSTVLEIQQDG